MAEPSQAWDGGLTRSTHSCKAQARRAAAPIGKAEKGDASQSDVRLAAHVAARAREPFHGQLGKPVTELT